MGAKKGERKQGVCAASPAFPSPLTPYPQDRCQGLCSKPTCPVRTVVMATGEALEAIGPLPATPLRHRFPVTEATERLCPPPSIPSREGCVGKGPAPSLANDTFLQNGGYSHTVINGAGEYERPFLNSSRCGKAVAEVTYRENRKWVGVRLL